MAWQLIYTSAPRLLEAGRTGFGTVARHRAVSGMLVSTVERFSQFARLPGHDPRRVVHTYRILTVGSGTYHVFSCLQDAGSDYTGRTNHLAQHVIAETREIRALSASGLNPADILLAIPWRSTWTEAPRFLDPAEEIDLAGFRPATTSAWATATGNPAYARLLCMPQALKGCYLIPPPGVNALELFREAMREAPQGGWQTSFTTTLEPNDEVGDFRWIGLPSGSPLRSQAEVSNRPLLDLTQPSKLPAPPEPPAQPASMRLEPEAAVPLQAEPAMPTRSPDKVSLKRPAAQPIQAATMGGWSPETRKAASKKSSKGLLVAIVIVSLLVASTAGFFLWQHVTKTKDRADFQAQINHVWDKHGLVLSQTRKKISEEPDLGAGRSLLSSLQTYVEQVQQVLKSSGSKVEPPQPEETSNLPEFEDLQTAFEEWRKIDDQGPTLAGTTASTLLGAYEKWLKGRTRCWKTLAEHLKKIGPLPENKVFRDKMVETAKELLRTTEPDTKDMSVWERLNKSLANDPTIADWLKIWLGLDSSDKLKVAAEAQNKSLPRWLTEKALKVQDASKPTQPTGKLMKAVEPVATIKEKIEDAESLEGNHKIYICLSNEDALAKIDNLAVAPDMLVYKGAAADKHTVLEVKPVPKTGELAQWKKIVISTDTKWIYGETMMGSDNLELDPKGKIMRLPNGSKDGLRIVARSKDTTKVLFDLRILPAVGLRSAPVLSSVRRIQMSNSRPGELTALGELINRLTFVSAATPALFKLRATTGVQAPFDLALNGASCQVKLPQPVDQTPILIDRKKNELASAQKELDRLENVKKEQEKFKNINLLEKTNQNITQKTSELERLKRELDDLNKPRELPAPRLPDGEYMLVAFISSGGVLDICKIQLVADKSKPSPSTK